VPLTAEAVSALVRSDLAEDPASREWVARAAVSVASGCATIGRDNPASLATSSGFGFTEVGEQWDDEDGLELIFELPA